MTDPVRAWTPTVDAKDNLRRWALSLNLKNESYTFDGEIVGFTGEARNGDVHIKYYSYVGDKRISVDRIVSDVAIKNSNQNVSPYLMMSAEAYRDMQDAVREQKAVLQYGIPK